MQTQKWKLAFEVGFIKGDLLHYTQTCTVTKVDICISANKVSICASNPCDPKGQDLYCTKHTVSDTFFFLLLGLYDDYTQLWVWQRKKTQTKKATCCSYLLFTRVNQSEIKKCVLKKRGATMTSFEVPVYKKNNNDFELWMMEMWLLWLHRDGWWRCRGQI